MKYVSFTAKAILKLLVQLIGILILPIVTYRYQLGTFPGILKYLDDYRARWSLQRVQDNPQIMKDQFGIEHTLLFNSHNSTWWGRYKWSAFRNACNYFQHSPLGLIWQDDGVFHHYGYIPVAFGYSIRYNIGYKYFSEQHAKHMLLLGIPLQWVFSIGIRKLS